MTKNKRKLDSISDNALMLKVKEGDLDRLGLLFERYHKVLLAFFYRIHHDGSVSEDLVQNVFMRILKYRHGFKGDGIFKVWMFHIARNVSHDQFRKDSRGSFANDDLGKWEGRLSNDDGDSDDKEIKDQLLFEALELLEPDKKELLVMSKLNGVKYREISEVLGITEGNVKVKVFRALGELRSKMQELNVNYEF